MKAEIDFHRSNPEMILVWLFYIWLAISAVAAPPLFRAQNQAGGAPPWTPTDYANLALWLDASDATTLTLSSSSVDEWRDKSGNAVHASSSGSSRPSISAAALNGRDVIIADGVNDLLNLASPISSSGSWTILCVQKRGTSGAISGVLMNYGGALSPSPPFSALDYGPLSRTYAATRTDQQYATIPSHAWHVYVTKNNAGTPSIRVDGANQSMTAASASGAYDFNSLFRRGGSTTQEYSHTEVGEVLMYSRLLSDSEIEQVEAYFAAKWNVP